MEKETRYCEKCKVELKPSQYVRREGTVEDARDILVCRNYPACSESEKEVD